MEKYKLINFCELDKFASKAYCAIHGVDESLNLGDINKVDEDQLPDFNMICGGSPCFVAGTKIVTKKGLRNIENVTCDDEVLTHNGRFMKVNRIGGEKGKEIYRLKAQGVLNIYATSYHPFYVKKTRNSCPEKLKLNQMKKGNYIASPINQASKDDEYLTEELLWILGRYVADGHLRHDKRKDRINSYQWGVVLSIGDKKVDSVKEHIKTYNYSCYPHTKSTYRVVINSKELVEYIEDNQFGVGALNKSIPRKILNLPIIKLKIFLDGYMSGDGCEIKHSGLYAVTTVSEELALNLCEAIQKVYRVGCRIYYSKRSHKYMIENRIVNQHDTYIVRFYKEDNRRCCWFIEDNKVWYPVRRIEKTNRVENVFNIEVNEDHTYVANGAIVYNCQDFSVSGQGKGSIWTCSRCGHQYNPLTVHWSKRDKCPKCGCEDAEKTRSSLLVEYLRVIRAKKPNFGIYENVKNIVGKKFKETFDLFTQELEEYGYNVYWKVLNAKDYGVPQNRERVYLLFIKKELDNGKFKFPDSTPLTKTLDDVLDQNVDEKYYINSNKAEELIQNLIDRQGISDIISQTAVLVNRKSIGEKTDIAPTLLARDYKGLANKKWAAGVIEWKRIDSGVRMEEVNRIGNIYGFNGGNYAGNVYGVNGIAPTIRTYQGGVNNL